MVKKNKNEKIIKNKNKKQRKIIKKKEKNERKTKGRKKLKNYYFFWNNGKCIP